MSFNKSLKSNTNLGGRTSPNLPTKRSDSFIANRTSSPPLPATNNRLSFLQQQENSKSESPTKHFSDDDIKFHKTVFERCAGLPGRTLITNRDKFIQGKVIYFDFQTVQF
jgi:hypothetical protein